MVLIFLRTAAGVCKPWENGSWNQANQLPLQPAPVCAYLLLTISQYEEIIKFSEINTHGLHKHAIDFCHKHAFLHIFHRSPAVQ